MVNRTVEEQGWTTTGCRGCSRRSRTRSGATWSPNTVTYTGNNRTHMIRIPGGGRFEFRLGDGAAGLLPAWYMPAAVRPARRGHRAVVALVIGAVLVVSGAGLCVTYGFPEIAW